MNSKRLASFFYYKLLIRPLCDFVVKREILSTLPIKKGVCLDVGCGSGYLTKLLEKKGFDVIGLELNFKDATIAQKLNGLRVIRADAQNMPLKKKIFDLINCTEVMEHLPSDVLFLKEVNRLIKPGGYFLITVPDFSAHKKLSQTFRGTPEKYLEHLKHARLGYSVQELKRLVNKFGFECVSFGYHITGVDLKLMAMAQNAPKALSYIVNPLLWVFFVFHAVAVNNKKAKKGSSVRALFRKVTD